MMNENLGLEEAIGLAMDAELQARDFYIEARDKVTNPRGRDLFERLANFEQSHYETMERLKYPLVERGAFIEYEGTVFGPKPASVSEAGGETPIGRRYWTSWRWPSRPRKRPSCVIANSRR
jgi:rubrerythrin